MWEFPIIHTIIIRNISDDWHLNMWQSNTVNSNVHKYFDRDNINGRVAGIILI